MHKAKNMPTFSDFQLSLVYLKNMNKRLISIGVSVAFLLFCGTFLAVSKYQEVGLFAPEPVPAKAQLLIFAPTIKAEALIKQVKKINGVETASYNEDSNILLVTFNARKTSDYGIISSLEKNGIAAQIPEEYRSLKIQRLNVDF